MNTIWTSESSITARQSALEETRSRLEAGRAEAVAAVAEAERQVAESGDETEAAALYSTRQSQLTDRHGLYEVTDGIDQVRGFDMSNMTLADAPPRDRAAAAALP